MGRWSRQLARRFVSWLQVPRGAHWLDVGCGTGALTNAICGDADPASVVGCDPTESFIEYARDHSEDIRASFVVAGVGGLPSRAGGYGCVASSLALNFFPDPKAAVDEMRTLASHPGVVSACVWDYGGGMQFLRYFWNAVATVDPSARGRDEGGLSPLCRPDALADLFGACGLANVRCEPIEIPTEFADFDDFWQPLLGGTGPAAVYVASLDGAHRARLAGELERVLPRGPGGTIALTARAWAVSGTTTG
jgi:SAM-dependent methyltransferase